MRGYFGAALCAVILSGCVATQGAAPVGQSSTDLLRTNCLDTVRAETNNGDVVIIGESTLGTGAVDYTVLVGGTGEWSCIITGGGVVTAVTFLGSDGSNLA